MCTKNITRKIDLYPVHRSRSMEAPPGKRKLKSKSATECEKWGYYDHEDVISEERFNVNPGATPGSTFEVQVLH